MNCESGYFDQFQDSSALGGRQTVINRQNEPETLFA